MFIKKAFLGFLFSVFLSVTMPIVATDCYDCQNSELSSKQVNERASYWKREANGMHLELCSNHGGSGAVPTSRPIFHSCLLCLKEEQLKEQSACAEQQKKMVDKPCSKHWSSGNYIRACCVAGGGLLALNRILDACSAVSIFALTIGGATAAYFSYMGYKKSKREKAYAIMPYVSLGSGLAVLAYTGIKAYNILSR